MKKYPEDSNSKDLVFGLSCVLPINGANIKILLSLLGRISIVYAVRD